MICKTIWEFLELMALRVGKGYTHFYAFEQKKPDKDVEIAKYYNAKMSKKQRHYAYNVKNKAVTLYQRWQNYGLILIRGYPPEKELPKPLKKVENLIAKKITIKAGNTLTLTAQAHNNKLYVRIEKNSYKKIKDNLINVIKKHANAPKNKQDRAIEHIKKEFNLLNGIPSYRGITKQKINLKKIVIKEVRRRGLQINKEQLKISYKRRNRLKHSNLDKLYPISKATSGWTS